MQKSPYDFSLQRKLTTLSTPNTQKDSEISTLNRKLEEANTLNTQKENSIQKKNDTIKDLENMIKFNEEDIIQLKKEIANHLSIISSQQSTINSLKLEVSKLEESEANKIKEITGLEENVAERIKEVSEQKEKEANYCQNISELQQKLATKTNECMELVTKLTQKEQADEDNARKISQLEAEKSNKEIKGIELDKLPCLSINMNSLLSLNDPQKGWKIFRNNFQELKEKKMITMAVLGMYDVGKSWFCNEFTGSEHYASGFSQTTDALNFIFPREKGNLIGIADTPGSNEAIRATDNELLQMIEASNNTNKLVPENEKEKYFWQYKQLKNDAKILQDLKERFISETADMVILICNKMSDKEQEVLYKMVKNFLKVMNTRNQKANKESKQGRETKFLIVHNYKNLSDREQVEEQIKKDLIKSFHVEPQQIFNNDKTEYENCNQIMYKDQFGVNHLLLACKNSAAGNYYNPSTFGYIKQVLSTMNNRTSTDVARDFYNFCSVNIPKILKQSDLKLEYDEERGVIHKNTESQNIVLEDLHYDEFGNFSISTFEPKYSINRKSLGSDHEEVTVDVELLDSEFKAKLDKNDIDEPVMRITGEKKVAVDNTCTREWGKFDIKIPIPKDKSLVKYVKIPETGIPDRGILRYVLTFGPENSKEL